eukprot:4973642-Amphidinium_carterae.1
MEGMHLHDFEGVRQGRSGQDRLVTLGMSRHSSSSRVNTFSLSARRHTFVCTDATAYESQHCFEDVKERLTCLAEVASANASTATARDVSMAVETAKICQGAKFVTDGQETYSLADGIFSAYPLTQYYNYMRISDSSEIAVQSMAAACKVRTAVELSGKGDDEIAVCDNMSAALAIPGGLARTGLGLDMAKSMVEVGYFEQERALCSCDAWRHPPARRIGNLVIGEPQGAEELGAVNRLRLAADIKRDLLRYGFGEVVADIVYEAAAKTMGVWNLFGHSELITRLPTTSGGIGLFEVSLADLEHVATTALPGDEGFFSKGVINMMLKSDAAYKVEEAVKYLSIDNARLSRSTAEAEVDVVLRKVCESALEPNVLHPHLQKAEEKLEKFVNSLGYRRHGH